MESSSNKYPLIPPNEEKCVWMSAGILSYQLCDRQFDCDHCPLDSALRTIPQRVSTEQILPTQGAKQSENQKLLAGYLYSRKHCWIKSQDGSTVRVGLEPLFSSMILGPKTVVLPSVGDRVQANKVCAWIVLDGGTLPVVSPLDGDVCKVNSALVDNPHDIRQSPYGEGWLFELSTGAEIFNLSTLFRLAEANRIYADDVQRFQSLVKTELKKHRASVGTTLPDGGQLVQNTAAMLGPERYFRLLCEVFS
jgi:glycine cleavage system H protein